MSRFKEIEGYNNDYLITEDGDVISVKRGKKILLKKRVNSRGYYYVNLRKMVNTNPYVFIGWLEFTLLKTIMDLMC